MSSGFITQRFPDLRRRLQEELRAKFSDELDFSSASVLGRLVDIPALQLAAVWELAEAAVHERSPDSATGGLLDEVAALVGLSRGDRSRVELLLGGQAGAVVPAGSVAHTVAPGQTLEFRTLTDATLSSVNVLGYRFTILDFLPFCRYSLTVNGNVHSYITGPPGVIYNVTGGLLAVVAGEPLVVDSQSGVGAHLIAPDPNTPLLITSGYAAPQMVEARFTWRLSYTYTLKINSTVFTSSSAGVNAQAVLQNMANAINASSEPVRAEVVSSSPMVLMLYGMVPGAVVMSVVPGAYIKLGYPKVSVMQCVPEAGVRGLASVQAEAVLPGAIFTAADAIRAIGTPVVGWQTVRNPQAVSSLGSDESDTAFRQRRLRTLRTADASVPEAIHDAIAALDGVAKVTLVENATAQTVAGRPPFSFEVVVENSPGAANNDQLIAERLWQVKPAGIATVSTVGAPIVRTVVDSMGFSHSIAFSRPAVVTVRVAVLVTPHPEEELPGQWQQLIRQAILDWGAGLVMGEDLIHSRVLGEVFSVPGVYNARVFLSRWPNGQPQQADLAMNFAEIARIHPSISVQ